jgi:pyruvate,water dikinase
VRIISDTSQIDEVLEGDILVAEMTTPDFVPAMKRAAAIVTDRGGRTCHAAIVSREMGLPCVVGTINGTTALQGISVATVDGGAGAVYEGDHHTMLAPQVTDTPTDVNLTTKTKLYVNLADPDAAQRVASMGVDGVGLLRAEFMIAHLGEHPRAMLESGRGEEYISHLAHELERFASAFHPRPVVYRFSDFKTNEYRNLKGGEAFEPFEENPMIGYRGCARYIAEPEVFALEVEALKRVREKYSNVGAMVPFVRTVSELDSVISLLAQQGLERSPDFKLWMMAELPSNFLLLDRFLDTGIDGVSIGSNDLTQLVLGVDRDNEHLAEMFDERDPAVLQAIEQMVKTCVSRGVTVSICGQGPSVYPELTRKLVEWGITSISVTPDMIQQTRQILHDVELATA